MPRRRGQAHPKAKLSDDEVDLIRDLREQHKLPYSAIAEKFECSLWTIADLCQYKTRAAR